MTHTRLILSGMKILSNNKWLENNGLIIENGKITGIIPNEMIKYHMPATVYHYDNSFYAMPGFIDLHVHGVKGFDVMDGTEEALQQISLNLAKEGVTGYLATTLTATNEQLTNVLKLIPQAKTNKQGAAILGVHLEGPFISPNKLGAQANLTQDPDVELFREWQELSGNNIKIVTLAPELPNALDFIRRLKDMQVITSIGHTEATYEQTKAAIAAGSTQATHLFNAMRGITQREPGAAGALLLSEGVSAEIIADGIHLHPSIVDLAWRVKHKDYLFLVTDAMRGKCMKDGVYDLGGQTVEVKDNKATLSNGTLAGSTLRMPKAIQHMMEYSHCTLSDAIDLATINPACALGLKEQKGSIELHKDADIVVLNKNFDVQLTLREGVEIYSY